MEEVRDREDRDDHDHTIHCSSTHEQCTRSNCCFDSSSCLTNLSYVYSGGAGYKAKHDSESNSESDCNNNLFSSSLLKMEIR